MRVESVYTIEDMCAFFRVHRDTINAMVQRGELPPPVQRGHRKVWYPDVVDEFIARQKKEMLK